MANVVKCDVCGKIVEFKDSRYVELGNGRYSIDSIVRTSFKKDVCLDCYNKVRKILNIKEK